MMLILLAAMVLSTGLCIYHLNQGKRVLLAPLFIANVSEQTKRMLLGVFYFQTIFFLISTATFLVCAVALIPQMYAFSLLLFIGLNYSIFAIWQLYIASISPPNSGLMLSLQALVFLLIGVLSMLEPLMAMM
ncbi:hypothetical protein N5094_12110 [Shewanella putrefaciens]|uniref:hypothetical protein n=1 Tax=Shewanella TaxID=22 RepID=UPI002002CC5D|nr:MULTISPECIES: hypothetical protein [Shewanella]MCK7636245.1 hypothetical protein [Shewanella sp. JNE17]MCK7651416.1 hypothetical protein [Shewanella sp. JNE8]MCK7659657.1 hypothetical protein [Shewanella sp. JNE4-2]UPO33235.1 hypothetical protein MZ182_07980 [Shewanella sp. JNE2]UXK07162.1 hypothetical protein N5094_12110 [Shewanella putrefaciens]